MKMPQVKDLAALQAMMGSSKINDADLRKALTTATGFVGYNLEPTAKLMLPLFAGLRNRVTVDKPSQGAENATWRMQLGYGTFNFGSNMGTAFGGVGGATTPAAVTVNAAYKTQAINGEVQFEAIPMARGFDDPLAIETSMALSSLIRLEEMLVLGGNSAALTQSTPAGNPSTATAVNTFGTGTWSVKVSALTLQGCLTNASSNSNVGESLPVNVDIVVPGGDCDFLDVYWTPVPGAFGYKVYCESAEGAANALLVVPATGLKYRKVTAGATDLANAGDAIVTPSGQTFVTVNHVQIWAVGTGAAAPIADATVSTLMFEGFLSWATKNTIYSQAVGTHINYNANGAPLTTAGSGVTEFDYILSNLWTQWQISPSLIVTSPNGASSLTDKLIAANNAAMYRVELNAERGGMTGGVFVGGYLNKFAASLMGQVPATISVWAHPYMPDGTFMFLTERVPYQYSREARGFALDVLTPYTYFELARNTRVFPFSTFFTETLKCYHPLAQAAIQGVRVQ
jgi:hypothetical protein